MATVDRGRARAAALLSALSLAGIVPHVIEDFQEGFPQRFGVPDELAGWLIGAILAAQAVAIIGATEGRRWAVLGVLALGVIWMLGAVLDHPGAFGADPFRRGLSSRAWVWLLIALQAAAAITAATALRSESV